MSKWVTDRPPTEAEVKDNDHCWITSVRDNGKIAAMLSQGFRIREYWKRRIYGSTYVAWMSVNRPEPYVPPNPKRKRFTFSTLGVPREFVEVLPGDIHPDEALAMRESTKRVAVEMQAIADDAHAMNALSVNVRCGVICGWVAKLRGQNVD